MSGFPVETAQHHDLAHRIRGALGPWHRFVIAVDGVDGVGKSTLGRYLSWTLGMPTIETDLFLTGSGFQYRDEEVRWILRRRVEQDRPVIVEGICVLDMLDRVGLRADFLVRVEDANQPEGSQRLQPILTGYAERWVAREPDFTFCWDSSRAREEQHSEREAFLTREWLSLSVSGALQRAHVYRRTSTDAGRAVFRAALKSRLDELTESYGADVTDDAHMGVISDLADEFSAQNPSVLQGGRFRIGVAQKALNLALKYRWCMGHIPEPPHCPFDGVVIAKLPTMSHVLWTKMDDPSVYAGLVDDARRVAGSLSLAQWEVALWNAR